MTVEPSGLQQDVSPQHDVVICGGGLGGLAAAVALAGAGRKVTLCESRRRLGGRASSFVDAVTGQQIDNCQHVSMGCCTNYTHFCRVTGLQEAFWRQRELYFIPPSGQPYRFAATSLPAPLHLSWAFAAIPYLSWSEKQALARGVLAIARTSPSEQNHSLAGWLTRHQQPAAVCERFWAPVMVSALSESLDRMTVGAAKQVVVQGFLAHPEAWTVDIPIVPLNDLYGGPLESWLIAHGVQVRLGAAVTEITGNANTGATGVVLGTGERLAARSVVCALPFYRAFDILPPAVASAADLALARDLPAAPISSVHLWFDRPVCNLRHAVLLERLSQWMFNRTLLSAGPLGQVAALKEPSYLQVVISASRSVQEAGHDHILPLVLAELGHIWPEVRAAKLQHSRMVTEQRAVFSPLPGSEERRPPVRTAWPQLYLAGDWVRTGWPATMEGAVRGGYLAAEAIQADAGQPEQFVQPDLPVSAFTRWLTGMS